jgi:hypothetical protein
LEYTDLAKALLPERYPARGRQTIDIELRGSAFGDQEPAFWHIERENLQRQFAAKLTPSLESREIGHLSVFALAPQPLLIELGRLLGDITPASVYQRHREPAGWRWAEDGDPLRLKVHQPAEGGQTVALILALSATVEAARVEKLLGPGVAVWVVQAAHPNNDILRRSDDLPYHLLHREGPFPSWARQRRRGAAGLGAGRPGSASYHYAFEEQARQSGGGRRAAGTGT